MNQDPGFAAPMPALIVFLFFLIILYAAFSASETALAASNKNKVKIIAQSGGKRARKLLELLENPKKALSSIQLIIIFIIFLASATAAAGISLRMANLIAGAGIPYPRQVSVILITILLSFIALVLGNFCPKKAALKHPEKTAMFFIGFIAFFSAMVKPFVFIANKTADLILGLIGVSAEADADEFFEDEVMSMLEVGKETGVLKEEGRRMIDSIFAFDDKMAHEVMTPRTDVFTIDIDDKPEEYVDALMEMKHSRIPVYENDSDNIIGILNIRDFLIKARENGFEHVELRNILRKPYFVPETKKIDDLFFDLQKSKQHIAILIDEYGGFSGIATMEDIIEEVMGDIDDEYDEDEQEIEKVDEDTYVLSGFLNLDDLNEELGINLKSDNIETIGGFLIDILGEIPDENDHDERVIRYENMSFTIESVKERRIAKVKLHIEREKEKQSDSEVENAAG